MLRKRLSRKRLDEVSNIASVLVYISSVIFLVFFGVLLSISLNVYLHEVGHYVVADQYGLNPSMHVTNVLSIQNDSLRVNMNPVAYVQYKNPGTTENAIRKNINVTVAGPIINLFLSIIFVLGYILTRLFIKKKLYYSDMYLKSKKYKLKVMKLCFLVDVIFISLIIPSFVSVIVNLSNIPGSDGAFLRNLIKML